MLLPTIKSRVRDVVVKDTLDANRATRRLPA